MLLRREEIKSLKYRGCWFYEFNFLSGL